MRLCELFLLPLLSLLLLAGCGESAPSEWRWESYEGPPGTVQIVVAPPGIHLPPAPRNMTKTDRYKSLDEVWAVFPFDKNNLTHAQSFTSVVHQVPAQNEPNLARTKLKLLQDSKVPPPVGAVKPGKDQVMTYVDRKGNTIRMLVPPGAHFPEPPAGAVYVTRNGMLDPATLPTEDRMTLDGLETWEQMKAKGQGSPAQDAFAEAKAFGRVTDAQWEKLDDKARLELVRAAEAAKTMVPAQASGRVGLKMSGTPEVALDHAVKLIIPRKPSDIRGAFLYRQYVEQHIKKIQGEPRARDQKAIDMMARFAANPFDSDAEICLMWKDVPYRSPLADYVYEHCEARVVSAWQMFSLLGRRFTWNADQLEAGGYSPYVRCRAQMKAALEILNLNAVDPIQRQEAQKHVDSGIRALSQLLEDTYIPTEALTWILDDFNTAYSQMERDPGPNMEKVLAQIGAKRPDALSWLRGEFLIHYAWFARGSGYANTVTDDARTAFHARLKEARNLLTVAWSRDQHPRVAKSMMRVCLGEGNRLEHAMWYNRALAMDPGFYGLHDARMQMLCEKWGGSHDEMFAFAREILLRYKHDPAAPFGNALLIAQAHAEMSRQTPDAQAYMRRKDVYNEIKTATELVIARHPKTMEAWACLMYHADIADDWSTVKRAYEAQNRENFLVSVPYVDLVHVQQAYDRACKLLAGKGKP